MILMHFGSKIGVKWLHKTLELGLRGSFGHKFVEKVVLTVGEAGGRQFATRPLLQVGLKTWSWQRF